MTALTHTPPPLAALLGSDDQHARAQAVELYRTLFPAEVSAVAARIAVGLGGAEPLRGALEQVWPGPGAATQRAQLLRSFAVDCALRGLPTLLIYRTRPWPGFAGRMPDLSVIDSALAAAQGGDRRMLHAAWLALGPAAGACRRWSRAAAARNGPSRNLERALNATRAIRHTCKPDPLDAARQASWAAQRAAASRLGEADWQRARLVERLLGAPAFPLRYPSAA